MLKRPAHRRHHLVATQGVPRQGGNPLGKLGKPIRPRHAVALPITTSDSAAAELDGFVEHMLAVTAMLASTR